MNSKVAVEIIKYLPADKGEIPRVMPPGTTLIGEGTPVKYTVDETSENYFNLKPGSGDLTEVVPHPDKNNYFIIARGQAYLFNVGTLEVKPLSYPDINSWVKMKSPEGVVFVARRSLVGILAKGREWIQSLDEINEPNMNSLRIEGNSLLGTGVQILGPDEIENVSFCVDLLTGKMTLRQE